MEESKDIALTEQEKNFCLLYMCGSAPYGGNAEKCYQGAFGDKSLYTLSRAKRLLKKPHIQDFMAILEEESREEAKDIKRYLTRTLMRIIDDCSEAEYRDRNGVVLNPAAMRSVAVNASKALMEMYPVKEAQVSKLKIGGEGEGESGPSVTFNVIVPGASSATVETKEEE